MSRKVQAPEETKKGITGADHGTTYSHPAFGQISASRVSGTRALYGSDFLHNHFIMIRISASEYVRDISNDWYHPRDEYIEVSLSEAQWATFVSSLNAGSGPCCTIDHANRQHMPLLPDPADRSFQFAGEVSEHLSDCLKRIKESIVIIDGLGLPKGKAATVKAALEKTLQDLTSNLPFIAKCFGEHTEDTVEKAKQEIHGYMTNMLMRAGLTAVNGGKLPLEIETTPSTNEIEHK